jgi:hypothetical protein
MLHTDPTVRAIAAVLVALLVAWAWQPLLELLPAEWLMALAGLLLVALAVLGLRALRWALDGRP